MALPKHNRIKHEATLKGLDGTLIYSPFTVADRRNLIAALSFDDKKAFVRTVADIVDNLSNLRQLDPEMRLHFIEAAFMKIYAASSGNTITATYTCSATVSENLDPVPGNDLPHEHVCGTATDISIPIGDIDIEYGPLGDTSSHVIKLGDGDDYFVEVDIPGWETVQKLMEAESLNFDDEFVLDCIKSVGGDGKVYTKDDFSREELAEWLNEMDDVAADRLRVFFSNLPVIKKDFDVTCPKCGAKRRLALRGIESFFGSPTTQTI